MKQRILLPVAAAIAIAAGVAGMARAADRPMQLAHDQRGGYGMGGMMGQGMMGPGAQSGEVGPGTRDRDDDSRMPYQGMGPGMMWGQGMGPGPMWGQGMGPGMMWGQGMGPGMMWGQQGMGPGMMWGRGGQAGSMGLLFGRRVIPPLNLSVDDVKEYLDGRLERLGNKRLKLGPVKAEKETIVADVVTVDNSLVQRLKIDRRTGAIDYEN